MSAAAAGNKWKRLSNYRRRAVLTTEPFPSFFPLKRSISTPAAHQYQHETCGMR